MFRKPYQELLYQTTVWCGLVLIGLIGNSELNIIIHDLILKEEICF